MRGNFAKRCKLREADLDDKGRIIAEAGVDEKGRTVIPFEFGINVDLQTIGKHFVLL